MKELMSATFIIGGLGWVTTESLLSGNWLLVLIGLLVGILSFAIIGCLPGDNAQVDRMGLIFTGIITCLGVVFAIGSFIEGKTIVGLIKFVGAGLVLLGGIGAYKISKEQQAAADHGHGH